MRTNEYQRLHAQWYDLVSAQVDHSREIDFWLECIRRQGQPVLELGCGTGRVLVPLLERNIHVVGIDVSTPMLDRCRTNCSTNGVVPELYEQSMLEFDLPYAFGLIMLTSGGLGLFVQNEDIQSVFARVQAHLKPGGLFVYEFELPPVEIGERSTRNSLPASDNMTLSWQTERNYDPKTRVWESIFTIEKSRGREVVESEVNVRAGRYFDVEEAERFAAAAGFTDITTTDWLSASAVSATARVATVRATKPG